MDNINLKTRQHYPTRSHNGKPLDRVQICFKSMFNCVPCNFDIKRHLVHLIVCVSFPVRQRHGCCTDVVSVIVSTVVNDYCHLVPSAASGLIILPQLSPHFCCNFITALTAFYTPHSESGPSALIDVPMKLDVKTRNIAQMVSHTKSKAICNNVLSLESLATSGLKLEDPTLGYH